MDWREAGFKEGRLLGWDWREEERRAGPVSGKRERVVGERECCKEVRESNPVTLFFLFFLRFLNYFNKVFSLSCYLRQKNNAFNFHLSYMLNKHALAF